MSYCYVIISIPLMFRFLVASGPTVATSAAGSTGTPATTGTGTTAATSHA